MSEKGIKTKPTASPKVKNTPKTASHSRNPASDIKTVAKDKLVRDVIKSKVDEAKQNGQSDRAEVQAAESVEDAAYTTADTAYHNSKTFVQNRIKKHTAEKKAESQNAPKTPENVTEDNAPKTPERTADTNEGNLPKDRDSADVKTKENYTKGQADTKTADVKTKDNYIKSHSTEGEIKDGVKQKPKAPNTPKTKAEATTSTVTPKTPKQARKEYVANKLKTKAEYEKMQAEKGADIKNDTPRNADPKAAGENAPKDKEHISADQKPTSTKDASKSSVKTKQKYMRDLRAERTEPTKPQYSAKAPKSKKQGAVRSNANKSKAVKTKQSTAKAKSVVKSGNVYSSANTARKNAQKAKKTKQAVKTQKEVAKKAAKEAAKKAKIAAQKAAQMAKVAAVKTAKAAVAVGKAIAAVVSKAAAAFFAAFGWIGVVVVLVILIVVIIVAAIAASPFGIFISDEAADTSSIPVSSIVNECNIELSARLTEIEDNTAHDRIVMEGGQADWSLVLSLFSVKVAGVEDDTVQDVVVIDDAKKQKLKEVFWDMHTITSRTATVTSGETTETVLYITITAKTKDEMVSQYRFSAKQKEALETLLENADGYIGATQSLAISDATAQEVIDNLPDSLSAERKNVVKKACSLVGKVTYFWGGKSSAIGWDSEWGKMKLVTAEGSRSTGCMRPFGLDCSGFVTWSFINSGFSASAIGHGTQGQIAKCSRISWNQAQAGDLAFLSDLSHVGIIAGKDTSGNILVIHCSSGANNVVITSNSIFGFAVRPNCY